MSKKYSHDQCKVCNDGVMDSFDVREVEGRLVPLGNDNFSAAANTYLPVHCSGGQPF